jgi:hypothetical protein
MDTYRFAVSEVLPDGRVVLTAYERIGEQITVSLVAYDDASLSKGKRYLGITLNNGDELPDMQDLRG